MGLLAAALLLSPFAAAHAAPPAVDAPYVIERSIDTRIEGGDGHGYRLLVSWPEGAPPPGGWPVLYLLDGADHFAGATEIARRMSRGGRRGGISPGIVVGIDSGPLPRRVFDYTPLAPGYHIPSGAPASGLETGGGDAFLRFVQTVVKPWVAARWRVDPARETLAGHSFGGLIALHALFTDARIATRYAAISPSLWFGDGLIAREGKAAKLAGQPALIAIGGDEAGPDGQSGEAAKALARSIDVSGGHARFLSLAGQGHGTTMSAALGNIVQLAFGEEK